MKNILILIVALVLIGGAGYQSYPYVKTYLEKNSIATIEEVEVETRSEVTEPYIPHHTVLDVVLNIYPYSNYKLAFRLERYSDIKTLLSESVKIDYVGDSIYYWDAGDDLHHFLDLKYYSPGLSIEQNLEAFRGGWDEEERTQIRNICTLNSWEADGVTYYQLGFDETVWRAFLTEKYATSRGLQYIGNFCGDMKYVLLGSIFVGYPTIPTDPSVPRVVSGSARLLAE
ncbi:hypothetical protein K2Y00_02195 [Patescibacteria group bacterium]|nr:hypothetical protein [Patescibacteria group bacterium]